jgi:Protein of unknown function (DUF4446)
VTHLTLVVVQIHSNMQIAALYAGVGALVVALIALIVYHVAVVRPALAELRRLLALHDGLIAGGSGGAADRLGQVEGEQASIRALVERVSKQVLELDTKARTDLSRIGFVRYDAFDDTGSDLSYALALLNRDGDGVVLTSIYSRTDTRTFGKLVEGFKPVVSASEEELQAIDRARPAPSSE